MLTTGKILSLSSRAFAVGDIRDVMLNSTVALMPLTAQHLE